MEKKVCTTHPAAYCTAVYTCKKNLKCGFGLILTGSASDPKKRWGLLYKLASLTF